MGETCESCPIFIVGHKDEDVDLRGNFLSKGILTTSGNDFVNMGKNFVRINTPPAADNILARWEANIICSTPCWLPSQEPARYDRSIPGVLVSSDNSSDMSHHPDPIGLLSSDP